jgi:hypothetical protein
MEIGRTPRLLTTAGGNVYEDGMWTPPWSYWRVYKSTKRYLGRKYTYFGPEEHVRHKLTGRIMSNSGGQLPFTSVFWLSLRLWMRRARRAVFTKALVRYHTPSLLGKRRVRE